MKKSESTVLEVIDYQELYQKCAPSDIDTYYLWDRLASLLWYLPDWERHQVYHALVVAQEAHKGQKRKSGEPFITHPVEVTRILAEMKLDYESLIAGLLHDTVEDTDNITFEDIEHMFGRDVRRIVEGETKLSKVTKSMPGETDEKAKDLQQLFLAMTEDVRIIMVKLADRLHNMRTLYGMKPEKQRKISMETLQVFAPLAKLLGIYCIKEELELLSLRYMEPDVFSNICKWQVKQAQDKWEAFSHAKADLEGVLRQDGYLPEHTDGVMVRIRQRPVYSIYKELVELSANASEAPVSTDSGKEASDVQAPKKSGKNLLAFLKDIPNSIYLQVVIREKADEGVRRTMESHQLCYHVLGLVHAVWSPIPGTLEDYIGSPKTNGYQSLHTTVVPLSILSRTPTLLPMEVQIRTKDMDALAELGVAASNWLPRSVKLHGIKVFTTGSAGNNQGTKALNTQLPDLPLVRHQTREGQGKEALPGQGYRNGNGKANKKAVDDMAKALEQQLVRTSKRDDGCDGEGPPSADVAHSGQRTGTEEDQLVLRGLGYGSGSVLDSSRSVPLWDAEGGTRDADWLTQLKKWREDFVGSLSAREFVDGITAEVLGQSVFVYTHKGELKRLPRGSTVVDFAYAIHTGLGREMVGAMVNGRIVQPGYVLSNGDVVEIKKDDSLSIPAAVRRHQQWLQVVTTKSAKLKIKQFLKENKNPLEDLEEENQGERSSSVETSKQLTVVCQDRMGLLAEVCSTISKYKHNIKAYMGHPQVKQDFEMSFSLKGPDNLLEEMLMEIQNIDGVESYSVCCSYVPRPLASVQSLMTVVTCILGSHLLLGLSRGMGHDILC